MATQEIKISQILNNIENYVIPNFQRPFVWNQERVKNLIDSAVRGFVLGMLYIWESSEDLTYDETFWHISDDKNKKFILDGQQRIKTSFLLFSDPKTLAQKSTLENSRPNYTCIFPSRNNKPNHVKNKNGYWIDMDYFLDLYSLENVEKYAIEPENAINNLLDDCWVSQFEIEKQIQKKEKFSCLTEIDINQAKLTIATISKIKKTKVNWDITEISLNEDIPDNINKVRYLSIHCLDSFQELAENDLLDWPEFNQLDPTTKRQLIPKLRRFFTFLDTKIKEATIAVHSTSVKFELLTYLFSRINMSVLPLDVFDLLVAKTYALNYMGKKINLRDTFDNIFNANNEYTKKITNFILPRLNDDKQRNKVYKLMSQYLALILDKEGYKDKYILKIEKEELIKLKLTPEEIPHERRRINHPFLTPLLSIIEEFYEPKNIFQISHLRFDRLFIIQTALYYKYYEKKNSEFSSVTGKQVFDFLEKWLVRELFDDELRISGSRPLNRYKKALKELNELSLNVDEVRTVPVLIQTFRSMNENELMSSEDLLLEFNNKLTQESIRYLLFNQNSELLDFSFTELNPTSEKLDFHHIFPKDLLKNKKIDKKWIDHICNFTILKYNSNIAISNKSPFEYIPKIYEKVSDKEKINQLLSSHFLPNIDWWLEKAKDWEENINEYYHEFLVYRARKIADLAYDKMI